MGAIRETILETSEDRRRLKRVPAFAPAGQSTQLIIGASPESDYAIQHVADRLYQDQALKRVYYSGYVPINAADPRLPEIAEPPLARENRLYQADWLMRLYGYSESTGLKNFEILFQMVTKRGRK
jgi:predicted DNA-binding helix-hairpin-helix protein